MKKKVEEQRFEFIFYINGNIICQRYFHIRGYNDEVRNSMDMKWCIDEVVDRIKDDLTQKTRDFLWANYDPYTPQTKEDIPTKDIFEKKDDYMMEIRVDKKPVAIKEFTGNYFPPKVRYQVNIKELIPSIISDIRDYFSQKKYTTEYDSVAL